LYVTSPRLENKVVFWEEPSFEALNCRFSVVHRPPVPYIAILSQFSVQHSLEDFENHVKHLAVLVI